MEDLTRLWLPTHPLHRPHPLPAHPPPINAIPDITIAVKKVAQKPAVLAS